MDTNQKTSLPLIPKSGGLAFSAVIIIYMLFSVIIQTILLVFSVTGGMLYTVLNALSAPLAIITVLIFSRAYSHRKVSYSLSVNGCNPLYFLIAVMASIGMFFGFGFVNGLISDALSKLGIVQSAVALDFSGVGSVILFTLSLGVIPAVTEELLFRGLMFKSLSGVKLWQGVLFVSLCFALFHCSVVQFVYQMIYGAVLCLLTYCAKSVLPAILAHFINNFAVILLTYLGVNIDFYNALIIIGGLVVLAVTVAWLITLIKKDKTENQDKDDAWEFWWPVGVFGVAICLTFIISNLVLGA